MPADQTQPKLNIYNLGSLGVNRVLSPVHKKDGELLQAQNALSKIFQGRDVLGKRWGMTVYNSTVLPSGVVAIHNLPLGTFADPPPPSTGSWSLLSVPFGIFFTTAYAGTPFNMPWYYDNSSGGFADIWDDTLFPMATQRTYGLENMNEDSSGSMYFIAPGNGGLTPGTIYKVDREMNVTLVKAPIGNPPATGGVTLTTTQYYQNVNTGGDADYVLGHVESTGSDGENYFAMFTYRISTDTYTWVGDPQRYTTNAKPYPIPLYNPYIAVVFNGKVIKNQNWFVNGLSAPITGYSYMRQILESASADTTGSWTTIMSVDGQIMQESGAIIADGGNWVLASAWMPLTSGSGASTYWNVRSSDGVTWSTISNMPNPADTPSTFWTDFIGADVSRTVGVIFAPGDVTGGGGTPRYVAYSTDGGDTWTQWTGSAIASTPYLWRAGDKYYLYDKDGIAQEVYETSASSFAGGWSTVSGLGTAIAALWPVANGIIRPTVPYTVY